MIEDRKTIKQTPWDHEAWLKSRWRPLMAYVYMIICVFDFVIAPLTRIWLSIYTNTDLVPWQSLTLSEGGLFHLSMGAILGVAAWTRGQEKIRRVEYGPVYSDYEYDYSNGHTSTGYGRDGKKYDSPTPPEEMTGN